MRVTLRAKLFAIAGTATLGFVVVIAAGLFTLRRTESSLREIQGRYLPRIDLAPKLEAQLERLQRVFQDAVVAHDRDALGAATEGRQAFLALLEAAGGAVEPEQRAALRAALDEYVLSAADVSRRLIAGETGEPILADMNGMQAKRKRLVELAAAATAFDRGQLAAAFRAATTALEDSSRGRTIVGVVCLLLVGGLSTWIARGVLRTVAGITRGLVRFGRGDFAEPIVVQASDELGDVAHHANEMAENLRRLAKERERSDWVKAGLAGLARELRGELEPDEVAARAARHLARALEVPAAALYVADAEGRLVLAGQHAGPGTGEGVATPAFRRGEGLVGQAALQEEVMVIADPPADHFRIRSGLGEAAPRALVLIPLVHAGRVTGVVELAAWKAWTDLQTELVEQVRETLAIALAVARARTATRDLLEATQRQAERLTVQEEELRSTNEELQAQEEELRQANGDLARQTGELETQRQLLVERNADLDQARGRLEQRASELAAVSGYKSQFLANMSHELRTPLNSMLLLSNLLAENEEGRLSAKQVEFARTIHAAGRDLLALINQVLDLAKVESGRQDVELAPADLPEIVAQLERIFAPMAAEKGLAFQATLEPGTPAEIVTDRRRLEQVLVNLLGNAVKFTSQGQVTFRIGRAAADTAFARPELAARGALAFAVTDTGLGIAPQDQERIFAPFEQVDGAADRRYGGTGLGLGIARELVTLLGGELQVTSELGAGSTFTCLIPLAPAERRPPVAPRGQTEEGPFLLLIEDDPIFATTFGDVIASQGLRHVHARSGEEGLRIAREERPKGIILDVKLPDTDGWRVMEDLRADPATAAIPVHFVSALDDADRGLALGAVGYLRKPVSRHDLLEAVAALLPASSSRFLIVEDDATTASSVLRLLESEGVEATRVATGEEALAALGRERFGCMILDLSLPEMSGLELLHALRDGGLPAPPRVIVYTARSLSRSETKSIEAYAEAVVLKDGASAARLLDEVRLFVRRFAGPRSRAAVPVAPVASDARLQGRKVLLADDDMRTAYALSATLRAKGLEVVVADTGKAALDALNREADFAAVLMDIMMPEMDGYEAMRRIRADGRFGGLPILALTAKAMKGDEERCLAAGATHYLAKPIDPDRLITLLASCLAAPGGAAHG